MTSQPGQLQELITEIEALLRRAAPRLPWGVSGEPGDQRRVLEATLGYLKELQESDTASAGWGIVANADTAIAPSEGSPVPSSEAADANSQQVLQALLQEMQYLRVQMVQPLTSEVIALQQQRETLKNEVRQLEMERLQRVQAAGNEQLSPAWLDEVVRQLRSSLLEQITPQLQALQAQVATPPLLTDAPPQDASEISANLPQLTPQQRLEQLRQIQAQTDDMMLRLDANLRAVFESLDQSIQSYCDTLNQGLDAMHGLGQQGEFVFRTFINHLAQQFQDEAQQLTERQERGRLRGSDRALSSPDAYPEDEVGMSSEDELMDAVVDFDDVDLNDLDLSAELEADEEVTLFQLDEEFNDVDLDDLDEADAAELDDLDDIASDRNWESEDDEDKTVLQTEPMSWAAATGQVSPDAETAEDSDAAADDPTVAYTEEIDSLYASLFGDAREAAPERGMPTETEREAESPLDAQLRNDVALPPTEIAETSPPVSDTDWDTAIAPDETALQGLLDGPPDDSPTADRDAATRGDADATPLESLLGSEMAEELSPPSSNDDDPDTIASLTELLPSDEQAGAPRLADPFAMFDESDDTFIPAPPDENLLDVETESTPTQIDLELDESIMGKLTSDLSQLEGLSEEAAIANDLLSQTGFEDSETAEDELTQEMADETADEATSTDDRFPDPATTPADAEASDLSDDLFFDADRAAAEANEDDSSEEAADEVANADELFPGAALSDYADYVMPDPASPPADTETSDLTDDLFFDEDTEASATADDLFAETSDTGDDDPFTENQTGSPSSAETSDAETPSPPEVELAMPSQEMTNLPNLEVDDLLTDDDLADADPFSGSDSEPSLSTDSESASTEADIDLQVDDLFASETAMESSPDIDLSETAQRRATPDKGDDLSLEALFDEDPIASAKETDSQRANDQTLFPETPTDTSESIAFSNSDDDESLTDGAIADLIADSAPDTTTSDSASDSASDLSAESDAPTVSDLTDSFDADLAASAEGEDFNFDEAMGETLDSFASQIEDEPLSSSPETEEPDLTADSFDLSLKSTTVDDISVDQPLIVELDEAVEAADEARDRDLDEVEQDFALTLDDFSFDLDLPESSTSDVSQRRASDIDEVAAAAESLALTLEEDDLFGEGTPPSATEASSADADAQDLPASVADTLDDLSSALDEPTVAPAEPTRSEGAVTPDALVDPLEGQDIPDEISPIADEFSLDSWTETFGDETGDRDPESSASTADPLSFDNFDLDLSLELESDTPNDALADEPAPSFGSDDDLFADFSESTADSSASAPAAPPESSPPSPTSGLQASTVEDGGIQLTADSANTAFEQSLAAIPDNPEGESSPEPESGDTAPFGFRAPADLPSNQSAASRLEAPDTDWQVAGSAASGYRLTEDRDRAQAKVSAALSDIDWSATTRPPLRPTTLPDDATLQALLGQSSLSMGVLFAAANLPFAETVTSADVETAIAAPPPEPTPEAASVPSPTLAESALALTFSDDGEVMVQVPDTDAEAIAALRDLPVDDPSAAAESGSAAAAEDITTKSTDPLTLPTLEVQGSYDQGFAIAEPMDASIDPSDGITLDADPAASDSLEGFWNPDREAQMAADFAAEQSTAPASEPETDTEGEARPLSPEELVDLFPPQDRPDPAADREDADDLDFLFTDTLPNTADATPSADTVDEDLINDTAELAESSEDPDQDIADTVYELLGGEPEPSREAATPEDFGDLFSTEEGPNDEADPEAAIAPSLDASPPDETVIASDMLAASPLEAAPSLDPADSPDWDPLEVDFDRDFDETPAGSSEAEAPPLDDLDLSMEEVSEAEIQTDEVFRSAFEEDFAADLDTVELPAVPDATAASVETTRDLESATSDDADPDSEDADSPDAGEDTLAAIADPAEVSPQTDTDGATADDVTPTPPPAPPSAFTETGTDAPAADTVAADSPETGVFASSGMLATLEDDSSESGTTEAADDETVRPEEWFLGIDLGATGLSAVLMNHITGAAHPLCWRSLVTSDAPPTTFRMATAAAFYPVEGTNSAPDALAAVGTEALTPNAANQLQLPRLRPLLRVGLPYQTTQGTWEPTVQWSDRQTLSLRQVTTALESLLTLLNPDADSDDWQLETVGLDPSTLHRALQQLQGIVVGVPTNWSDTYCFNVREALLAAGLIDSPGQIFFVEEAIAAILSGLPDPDDPPPEPNRQVQTLYQCNWQGGTVVISSGAACTEVGIVDLPQPFDALSREDFKLRNLAYGGDALDLDIICQLLIPPERRQLRAPGDRRSTNQGWSWQAALPEVVNAQWDSLELDAIDLPQLAEPDLSARIRLRQHLEVSKLGQSLLEAARHLKLILQNQNQFQLDLADQSWRVLRRDLESRVLVPYIQRLNQQVNALLSQTGLASQGINQVICTGGNASFNTIAKWLRQKFPNATIIQDTYPSNRPPTCSRVAYGLVNLCRYPQALDVPRHQYSDYFLLHEILRHVPDTPMPYEGIIHLLEEQGINTEVCQSRITAILEGHLPPGLIPDASTRQYLSRTTLDSEPYQVLTSGTLFSKQSRNIYMVNARLRDRLRNHLAAIMLDKRQTLADPLIAQLVTL